MLQTCRWYAKLDSCYIAGHSSSFCTPSQCTTAQSRCEPAYRAQRGKLCCALLQPSIHQQTLRQSFTVGGLGLHTAEYGELPHPLQLRWRVKFPLCQAAWVPVPLCTFCKPLCLFLNFNLRALNLLAELRSVVSQLTCGCGRHWPGRGGTLCASLMVATLLLSV